MKTIKVKLEEAIGMVLCHDITEIVPGEKKGRAFSKGHIILPQDLDKLRSLGKNHIHVLDMDADDVHEDDAAILLGKALSGNNIEATEPYESRVNLVATANGLLKINLKALYQINSIDDVTAATLSNYSIVKEGEIVAGTKVTPLTVKQAVLDEVIEIEKSEGKVLNILSFKPVKAGIIITGTEVYKGIIKDAFEPVLRQKVEKLGGSVIYVSFAPDEEEFIRGEIQKAVSSGCDIIMVSGGMSVDADDVTPKAIKSISTVVKYGSPVLPGAMFMLGYIDEVAVVGIPACGMYSKITVLDIIYPRLAAGLKVTKEDIIALANGGLCRKCEVCTFPICSFGKG